MELQNLRIMKISSEDKDILQSRHWNTVKTSKHTYSWYLKTRIQGKTTYLHRLVMERMLGRKLETSERIDHINGDGTDNRRENLRMCTQGQNLANQPKRKNGTSKYKGVSRTKSGKWTAKITVNYKHFTLGCYEIESHAAKAYNKAAKQLSGEYARLNAV